MRLFLLVCFCSVFGCKSVGADIAPLTQTFSSALHNALERCLQRVEHAYLDDPEFEFNLQTHCQALAQQLATKDLSPYIQQPLDRNLTLEQVMDLQSISATINTRHTTSTYGFDFQGLHSILDSTLVLEQERDLSMWRRFLNWLAGLFDKTENQQPDWLKEWLAKLSIPEGMTQALYTAMVILLSILFLAIVVAELRAAGIRNWLKRRSQRYQLGDTKPPDSPDAMLTWDAILRLPAREKILGSYNKLLHLLANKNLIPKDESLTNHELQTCLEKSLGGEQAVFRQLIRGVEATLYGDIPPDQNSIDQISRQTSRYAESLDSR